MSANFQKNDSLWILSMIKKGLLTKEEAEQINVAFDNQTDFDANLIQKELDEIRLFKKVSLLKLLTFPLEAPLSFLIFGKEEWKTHKQLVKIYYRFLTNKITHHEFKKSLQNLAKDDKLI